MDQEHTHTPTTTTPTTTETPKSTITQSSANTAITHELTTPITTTTTPGTSVVMETPTTPTPTPTTPVFCTSDGHLVFPLPLIEGLDPTSSTSTATTTATTTPPPTPIQTSQNTPIYEPTPILSSQITSCSPTPIRTSQITPISQPTPSEAPQTPIQTNSNTPISQPTTLETPQTPIQTSQITPTQTPTNTPSPSPRPHTPRRPIPRRPAPQPPSRPGPPTTPVPHVSPSQNEIPLNTKTPGFSVTGSQAQHTETQGKTSANYTPQFSAPQGVTPTLQIGEKTPASYFPQFSAPHTHSQAITPASEAHTQGKTSADYTPQFSAPQGVTPTLQIREKTPASYFPQFSDPRTHSQAITPAPEAHTQEKTSANYSPQFSDPHTHSQALTPAIEAQTQAQTSLSRTQTQAQVHVSASTTGSDFSMAGLSLRLIDDDMSSDDGSGRLSDYFDDRIVFPSRPSQPNALERIVLTKPSPLTPIQQEYTQPNPKTHTHAQQFPDTGLVRDHRYHRALTHSFSDPGIRRTALVSPSNLHILEEEEWDGLSSQVDSELYRGDFGRVREGGCYRFGRVSYPSMTPCQKTLPDDIYERGSKAGRVHVPPLSDTHTGEPIYDSQPCQTATQDKQSMVKQGISGRVIMPPLPTTQTLANTHFIYDSQPCQIVTGSQDKQGMGKQGTSRVNTPSLPYNQTMVGTRDIKYNSKPCQIVTGSQDKHGMVKQGSGRVNTGQPSNQTMVERDGRVERDKLIPLSRTNSAIGLPEDLMAPRPSLTGIAALALLGAALMPGTAMLLHSLFRLVFGTLFPAYYSYKAVKTKNVKEYVKWMMYWIVFAFFTCLETLTDIFLSFWFPFYYELKILVVLWLLSPATRGSSILYRKFVHPWLTRREEDIDNCIAQAKQQGYSAVLSLGSKGVNYATTVIMNTAIKGGGGLMNQLKRSYSSGELISDDGDMNRNIKPLPPHHQDYDDPHIRPGTPPHLHLPPTPPTYPESPSPHDLNESVQSYHPSPITTTVPSPTYPSPPLTRRRRREILEERRLEEERLELMEK